MPQPTNPPPPLFDILPPLHTLLTRLLLPDALTPSPTTPLSPKDLATAASSITTKIQKARLAARELPGVEMGIQEQEEVIRELEGESRRLRGVEEGIGMAARRRLEGVGEAMES